MRMTIKTTNHAAYLGYWAGRSAAFRDDAMSRARREASLEQRQFWTRNARFFNHLYVSWLKLISADGAIS
jgi:hypothetical protein